MLTSEGICDLVGRQHFLLTNQQAIVNVPRFTARANRLG